MMPNERKTRMTAYALFIGAAVIGLFALAWTTGRGSGLQPDSAFYLDCAKHIRAGDGYATTLQDYLKPISLVEYLDEMKIRGSVVPRPEVVFPPLFSYAIAALTAAGLEPMQAGRWIGLILFGANIFLAAAIVFKYTAPSRMFALAAAALMFGSETMLTLHANVLSEPLFLFLGLLGLLGLSQYVEDGAVSKLLLGSLAVGLAFLTRYAGGALVVAGGLGFLGLRRIPIRRRLISAAAFLTISCLPMLIFIVRNERVVGSATNRRPLLVPPSLGGFFLTLKMTFSSWVFPNLNRVLATPIQKDILSLVSLVLLAAIGGGAILLVRLRKQAPRRFFVLPPFPRTPWLFALYLPVYLAFILFSAFFMDRDIPFDIRILSPFFITGLIVGIVALSRIGDLLKNARIKSVLSAAFGLYVLGYLAVGAVWVIQFHGRGGGYNNQEWRSPEMAGAFARIAAEPPETPILTNDNAAVYFIGGRDSYFVPFARNLARLDALKAEIGAGPVLFFYFKTKMHVVRDEAEAGLSSDRIEQALVEHLSAEVLVRRPTVTLFRMNPP